MAKPDGDGFPTIAEAAELALAEVGEGNPTDSEPADPAEEETLFEEDGQAEEVVEEQPETEGETETLPIEEESEEDGDEDDEDDSLFADFDLDDEEAPEGDDVDLDSMVFELPNGEEVEGIQALKDGFMRHADYTQKTQQLADQRKALETQNSEATRVYEALRSNPLGFFASLAEQVGVDVDVQGAKNPDFKFDDNSDFEAEVEKRVNERIANDPDIQKARDAAARAAVDDEFAGIESTKGVTLGDSDRQKVLNFALKHDISNLEVAFDAMMARINAKQQETAKRTERAKKTSTKRSTGRVSEKQVDTAPSDVAEAMERATAEIAAR